MQSVSGHLTVLFKCPFWIGIFERCTDGKLTVSRTVFGAEPKEYEVYEYFLKNWNKLRFSPPISGEMHDCKAKNPKRIQREIRSRLSETKIGTKAQQALQVQQEQAQKEHKKIRRQKLEADKERQFLLRQQKKKEKHKGR